MPTMILRAVRVDPGSEPREVRIDDTLQAMQAVVGGNLEQFHTVPTKRGRRLAFYCNEDGRRLQLSPNRCVAGVFIVGSVLVAAVEGTTEVDLTDDEVDDLQRAFKRWPKTV